MERTLCTSTQLSLRLPSYTFKSIVCPNCHHGNIRLANFCGNCGNKLEKFHIGTSVNAAFHSLKSLIGKITAIDLLYRLVLVVALLLVLGSGVVSYKLLNDTSVVKVSSMPFTDVPMNHPVYFMCSNLLSIKGISHRSFLRLAPYDVISAPEWNYAVRKIAEKLGNRKLLFLCFSDKEEVTDAKIRGRLESLGFYHVKHDKDVTRISAYATLENLLLERGA